MTPEKIKEADTLRANSDLKSSEYATPVLGMIFLEFADYKYIRYEDEILDEYKRLNGVQFQETISHLLRDIFHMFGYGFMPQGC